MENLSHILIVDSFWPRGQEVYTYLKNRHPNTDVILTRYNLKNTSEEKQQIRDRIYAILDNSQNNLLTIMNFVTAHKEGILQILLDVEKNRNHCSRRLILSCENKAKIQKALGPNSKYVRCIPYTLEQGYETYLDKLNQTIFAKPCIVA